MTAFYCYCCACFERAEKIIKETGTIVPTLPDATTQAKLKLARKWMQTGAIHATLVGHDEECPRMKRALERQSRSMQQLMAQNGVLAADDKNAGHA